MKQHSDDYKLSAVMYYINHNEDLRDACDIFKFIKNNYKNYLIIMDNAVIHKSKLIKDKIENDSNKLLYSVPYHPETNSIEEFFSQLKHYIKKQSPNTYEDIDKVIKDILQNKIQKKHLTNYLKHSYRIYK
jgi:transposase